MCYGRRAGYVPLMFGAARNRDSPPGGATRVETILLTLKSAIARANHANGKRDGRESEMDSTGRQVSQRKMRAVAILRP